MVSGKRFKYQQKQILDVSLLFTIKNAALEYTLYHLENCFFLFYVYFKEVWYNKNLSMKFL